MLYRQYRGSGLASSHGADVQKLVSRMPGGPGAIPEEKIAETSATVPGGIAPFLLTSPRNVDEIVDQHRRCGTKAIQLVNRLAKGCHTLLKRALPGIRIVQVVHVDGESSIQEVQKIEDNVDALPLDSGSTDGRVKELGGIRWFHDWAISLRIVRSAGKPVFLTSGLQPDNVSVAVRSMHP